MGDVHFVVPFGRDGAADRAAREFARSLSVNLLIENHPGAGGLLGVQRANALAQSGRPVLLLATPSTHILLPARLGTSAVLDAAFKPMAGLGSAPNVLLVSPTLGVRTVAELIDRARVGELVYASAGAGQTIHVCTALLCAQAGISMEHRPYDAGSAAAYDDLIAGRVHVYFDNLLGCSDRIERGDAVPLAVSSTQRSPALPGVPTLVECGFPEHALDVWLAVFGAHVSGASLGIAASVLADTAFRTRVDESKAMWTRALEAQANP